MNKEMFVTHFINFLIFSVIGSVIVIWVKKIANRVINTISNFELNLERNFVKKNEFVDAIADAKDGRKNLWQEFRATKDHLTDIINDYALKLTKEVTQIKTKLHLKEIDDA